MESGFLMLPQIIPVAAPEPFPTTKPDGTQDGSGPTVSPTDGTPTTETGPTIPGPGPTPSAPAESKSVELDFEADRNQLFTAWNAIANLADLAGKVNVTVRADSDTGFDKSKLQNGVLEPLREADLL